MPHSNHFKCDNPAAAPAKHKKAELVTTDLEFKSVEQEIKINWLK